MISWYGFQARLSAIWHKITHPSHRLVWRYAPDELCPGDIVCNDCDLLFWCRAQEISKEKLDEFCEKNR